MGDFFAFVMRVGGRIKEINGYDTEAEADAFGIKETRYQPLDPNLDPPDFYEKYDPPIVIVVEADSIAVLESGKYMRPVAIYQRGEKWVCVKQESME